MTEIPLQRILDRLEGVARLGGRGEYKARCPTHADKNPSLSIGVPDDGKVLLYCHGGCTIDDICAALDIDKASLFVQKGKTATRSQSGRSRDWESISDQCRRALSSRKLEELASSLGVRPASLKSLRVGYRATNQCFTFPERDAQNRIIGITHRYQDGSQKAIVGGRRGLVIPDRLDELTDPVLIVEGASDVAACLSLRLTAIGRPSNRGGVVHLADLLSGQNVLVVGENDRNQKGDWPGQKGAIRVAQELATRWERETRWTLPPEGSKDIREWLKGQRLDLEDKEQCRIKGQELLDELVEAAQDVPPKTTQSAAAQYQVTNRGLIYLKPTGDGSVPVALTNFKARIVADVLRDDGEETTHSFEIEAQFCAPDARPHRFAVPASRFSGLGWIHDQLGARAVLYPGYTIKDHARAAIQLLSDDIGSRRVFAHTGWRKFPHGWCYLHGGGAIGETGSISDVEVDLPPQLQAFVLASPLDVDELSRAVKASLAILDLGPDHITVPILGAIYRAVVRPADFSLHLTGRTSTFKTELATLAQQHFGPSFNARNLPGSWSSTANALEILAFTAKDALLVVDDFAPQGTAYDVARLNREADRLLRAQGNRSGRGRLRPDGSPRPVKAPRGLIVSTGEDVPGGESLRGRMLILELGEGDIDAERLTEAQANGQSGLYASAMAGFLRWLASRYEEIQKNLHKQIADLRRRATSSNQHRRTPDIVASLAVGLHWFLRFAQDIGAVTESQVLDLDDRCWKALGRAAEAQSAHLRAADQVERFLQLICSALASGRAHLANSDGDVPETPQAWGWREHGSGHSQGAEWHPGGDRIGWVEGDDIYLEPGAAYKTAQAMTAPAGDGISVRERTLWKRMHERGLLASTEDRRETLKVRRKLERQRRSVLHLKTATLFPDHESGENLKPRSGFRSGSRDSQSGTAPPTDPQTGVSGPPPDIAGPDGRVGRVSEG